MLFFTCSLESMARVVKMTVQISHFHLVRRSQQPLCDDLA